MHDLSLTRLAADLAAGKFSSVELTQHYLARIDARNAELNAVITVCADTALASARESDERRARGQAGPLDGIPVLHKDIFCTQGVRTSCGSKMLDNFVAPYDATVVAKLKAAGTVMLGKTNMDEFAMGSSNENSYYGPVRNPWDTQRVPGGSSGGSACAVAAGLAPCATGTDTGGSIRQPASYTGITGIKPTYGRVSRHGMIAFASSLDQGGVFANSAADAAQVLGAIAGFDPYDSTSAERAAVDYADALAPQMNGLRIGVVKEFFDAGLDGDVGACVTAALARCAQLGAELIDVSLPNIGMCVPTYYVVASAECSSNLSRFDGVRFGHRCENPANLLDLYTRSRGEGFGAEVKRRIMTGTYVLSAGYYDAYYLQAQKTRRLISAQFAAAFQQVDLLLGPTAPTVAFGLGEMTADPVTMYLNDIYTIGASLAGLPAMSVPCGQAHGLPVGLQMIAPHFAEQRVLDAAHAFQCATDWHLARAPGCD